MERAKKKLLEDVPMSMSQERYMELLEAYTRLEGLCDMLHKGYIKDMHDVKICVGYDEWLAKKGVSNG